MLTNRKHESMPKKKSRFNFWSEHSHNTQVNDLHESEAFQDAGDNNTNSSFQKTLKKFKTSSLRLKKKLGIESVVESKTLRASPADDYLVQHCNQTSHIFSDQSLVSLEGLHPQKSFTSNNSATTHHALLAGIGFLGNLTLFQTKSITLPELKSRQDVENNVKNCSLSNSEILNVNENFRDVLSNEIERSDSEAVSFESPESLANCTDALISQSISSKHKTSAVVLQQNLSQPDCILTESAIREAEHSVAEESTSPESQSDGNIWKLRVEGVEGEERMCQDEPREVDHLEIMETEEFRNSEMNDIPIGSFRFNDVDTVCQANGDDKDSACCAAGWEARNDKHGRVFYVDHVDKTTSWTGPQPCRCCSRYNSNEGDIVRDDVSDLSSSAALSPASSVETKHVHPPGVVFLIRPDFYSLLRKNQEALSKYNKSPQLKHMINKIRWDADNFNRYQHNRDLVCFLNAFSDESRRLPTGWEMRFDKSSRPFFVDHIARNTTFVDPRLPTSTPNSQEGLLGRSVEDVEAKGHHPRSLSMSRSITRAMSPEGNEVEDMSDLEKVVCFLRQTNINDLLVQRCPELASNESLVTKVEEVASRGIEALHRFSDDVELNLLLSQFEAEISSTESKVSSFPKSKSFVRTSFVHSLSEQPSSPSKHNFQTKLTEFYKKLESRGYASGLWKVKLEINRDRILEDSFKKILEMTKRELHRSKLLISFAGEEGLDYGGPSKEFFFLISRELFNPCYGLFEYSSSNAYTLQISPMSIFMEDYCKWFRFAGRIVGLAVLHQYLLDVFFVRPFYKALLKECITMSDLESVDYEFFRSLEWIRRGEGVDFQQLGLNFSVDEEVAGKITQVELKPNGSRISVGHKNRKDYVDRMVKWRMLRGVEEQTNCLVKGFHEVLDFRLLSKFDAHELEFVISGTTEVDVGDWRRNTDYRAGYHDQHVVIGWFWSVVDEFTNEMRLRLLQFVTGTSSLPHEGFAALRGYNGPKRFSIEKWGEITSLPRAHTCFNRLDLPPYTSRQMVKRKLTIAVEETSTYGIE